jgi:hypothetical protein
MGKHKTEDTVEMSSQTFLATVQEQHQTSGPLSLERLRQIKEELEARPSEKAKPPKAAGVTLSIGCRQFYMNPDRC